MSDQSQIIVDGVRYVPSGKACWFFVIEFHGIPVPSDLQNGAAEGEIVDGSVDDR